MSLIPTTTITTRLTPPPAPPRSTKAASLQTMEIAAIVGVSCIVIIAIISLSYVLWRLRRHDRLNACVDENGRDVVADSSFSSATTKVSAYFPAHISSVYKDATPLLDHTQPVPNHETLTPTEESSLYHFLPEDKERRSRQLPPLVIPGPRSSPIAAILHSRSLDSPDESSPTESFADTPSIYSQPSAYPTHLHSPPLSRGPSSASRAAGRVPHTEHPLPPLPSLLEVSAHRPGLGGLDIFDVRSTPVPGLSTAGLARQNTTFLLKSRQQKQADDLRPALSSNPSIVSHIERSGSINTVKSVIDREPYGRRVRRIRQMKAERNREKQRSDL